MIKLKGTAANSGREIVFGLSQIEFTSQDTFHGDVVAVREPNGYTTDILERSITMYSPSAPRDEALRAALAAYAHEAWAGWMRYLFSKCFSHEDGSLIIPPRLVCRWARQMCQPYSELTYDEMLSDLAEADKMLKVMTDGKTSDKA